MTVVENVKDPKKPIRTRDMKHIDSHAHVTGTSLYVDDIPEIETTLFADVVGSPIAHGKLLSIDKSKAMELQGVHLVLTAADIPGINQIGGIIPDEPLLPKDVLAFLGQPTALVIAESTEKALDATKLVNITFEELEIVTNPRDAAKKGLFISNPRAIEHGNVDEQWSKCTTVVEGSVDIGGQEHLYIEGQGAYAIPIEGDKYKVISSTQAPTLVQKTIARILNLPMHNIEVEVRRIGGGFGGKEDQATIWACLAALGAYYTKRPVKLILNRMKDMQMSGKRHPYEADYKLGLNKDGKILAYEVTFYQNAGSAADLSPAVLGRTLLHANNSYHIPHLRAKGYCCKTNLVPFTAFRGFGGPQGMFVIEAALVHAAKNMGFEVQQLQKINLLKTGDQFHYGQLYQEMNYSEVWETLENQHQISSKIAEIKRFNESNLRMKQGYAIMPICFGISFNKVTLNQAGALVHIYQDGSISLSTGAVEMGQGVNTRLVQVPLELFGLPENYVNIETTNTTRVANTSASAASSTHDLNGEATKIACQKIKDRLITLASDMTENDEGLITLDNALVYVDGMPSVVTWEALVFEAYSRRIDLSAHGFYATPGLSFDMTTDKGHPFAYHSLGIGFISVTMDCLYGTYQFDEVSVAHDFGNSMNVNIDLGQMEGGIVQGLGWMSLEELVFDEDGRLRSNALSTYKIPDLDFAPKEINIHFIESDPNPMGLFRSKAIGEPPLLYGVGGYFALRDAILAFNANADVGFTAPLTPEKTLLALMSNRGKYP